MSAIDFKRVRKIPQKYKDIVHGYIKRVQVIFPEDNPYFTIVELIQDLCLLYFCHMIDSKILTNDEHIKLYDMVNTQLKNKFKGEWMLLFRATRDGFARKNFYDKCDGKDNTICIIRSEQNNVFGGYTSSKWNKKRSDDHTYSDEYDCDPFAFIYKIRSNGTLKAEIFPVTLEGICAVQHYRYGYLSFGDCGNALYFQTGLDDIDIEGRASWMECQQYGLEECQLNGVKCIFQ